MTQWTAPSPSVLLVGMERLTPTSTPTKQKRASAQTCTLLGWAHGIRSWASVHTAQRRPALLAALPPGPQRTQQPPLFKTTASAACPLAILSLWLMKPNCRLLPRLTVMESPAQVTGCTWCKAQTSLMLGRLLGTRRKCTTAAAMLAQPQQDRTSRRRFTVRSQCQMKKRVTPQLVLLRATHSGIAPFRVGTW